ncbi:MAG: DUF2325 domain-containing protein [Deltaproteobacteria bacterium]|nr:DUF2325 domain-containing protein [Deltaproteobacteria bacterium]MCL4874957.1 DUF2325 domain-containing protein [bacterium]
MCIAVIGGMDRLSAGYREIAGRHHVTLQHYLRSCPRLERRLGGVDAIIVFSGMASHKIANAARSTGRAAGVPVVMCKGCGVSSFERCLAGISGKGVCS